MRGEEKKKEKGKRNRDNGKRKIDKRVFTIILIHFIFSFFKGFFLLFFIFYVFYEFYCYFYYFQMGFLVF